MTNPSIVKIIDGHNIGSGVVVGSDKVVTCFHVIRSLKRNPHHPCEVEIDAGGRRFPGRVLRADESHDLCLLEVPGLNVPALPLSDQELKIGDRVSAVGYHPIGQLFDESAGTVEHLNQADDHPIAFTSAQTWAGCSGGALLDDQKHLAGVVGIGLGNGILPLGWVKDLLARTDNEIRIGHIPPVTEMDFYNRIDRIENSDRGVGYESEEAMQPIHDMHKLASEWVAERPQSYYANITLARCANSPEEQSVSLAAAKRANAIYPTLYGTERILELAPEPDEYARAVKTYKRIMKLHPERREAGIGLLGNAALRLPANERIAEFKELTEQNPKYYENLGEAYYDIRDFDNALKAYQRYFETTDDEHLKGFYSSLLGDLALKLGRTNDAVTSYRSATQHYRNNHNEDRAAYYEKLAAQTEGTFVESAPPTTALKVKQRDNPLDRKPNTFSGGEELPYKGRL